MDGERLDENVEVEKPRARFHARERRKKGRGKQVPERRPAARLAAHHRRSIAALCPLQNTLAIGDQRPTSRSTLRWVGSLVCGAQLVRHSSCHLVYFFLSDLHLQALNKMKREKEAASTPSLFWLYMILAIVLVGGIAGVTYKVREGVVVPFQSRICLCVSLIPSSCHLPPPGQGAGQEKGTAVQLLSSAPRRHTTPPAAVRCSRSPLFPFTAPSRGSARHPSHH